MKVWSGLAIVAVTLALAGCEVGVGSENGNSSSERKYNFTYNGCSTGDQVFDSNQAYCDGLRDQARNHGCAVQTRREAFQRDCGGTWSLTGFGPIDCEGQTCDGATQYCLLSYVGASTTPTSGAFCANLPSGFNFESGCDSLGVDAKTHFPTSNNCGGTGVTLQTFCSTNQTGAYKFVCHVSL